MPLDVKSAVADALMEMITRRGADKITVKDLVEACGISRQTFYYHFKDIYDLIEWVCVEDATSALQGKKTYDTWQEGMLQIFEAVYENKPFVLNAYRTISREQIENYLHQLTYKLIRNVVEEKSVGTNITDVQKQFIAEFYKYSFVGIMLDWIKNGMKNDYNNIVECMAITLHGNIPNSIQNFSERKENTKYR